jgi:ankyrin repeat protein
MVAAAVGHVEVVAELLNRGARVDNTDKYGRTPFIMAALQGHADVVTKLLNYGATIDITYVNRRTSLSNAA